MYMNLSNEKMENININNISNNNSNNNTNIANIPNNDNLNINNNNLENINSNNISINNNFNPRKFSEDDEGFDEEDDNHSEIKKTFTAIEYNEYIANKKKLYCVNCGKRGHIQKKCLYPIISIGIICLNWEGIEISFNDIIHYTKKIQNHYHFNQDEFDKIKFIYSEIKKKIPDLSKINTLLDNSFKYLLIRRRNSLNYIELIRGKYDVENMEYLETHLEYITNDERQDILNNDFSKLWCDLWEYTSNYQDLPDYIESKQKFDMLKNGIIYKKNELLLKTSFEKMINRTRTNYIEPEWGFPKGRRNSREKNVDCAKREFEEETNISTQHYHILNFSPIEETYMASNHLKYKHIYYISQALQKVPLEINFSNKSQRIEIGDIQWLTIDETLEKIREYNIQKKYLVVQLHNHLKDVIENFMNLMEKILSY